MENGPDAPQHVTVPTLVARVRAAWDARAGHPGGIGRRLDPRISFPWGLCIDIAEYTGRKVDQSTRIV